MRHRLQRVAAGPDVAEIGALRVHHLQAVPTSYPDLRLTQFVPADDASGRRARASCSRLGARAFAARPTGCSSPIAVKPDVAVRPGVDRRLTTGAVLAASGDIRAAVEASRIARARPRTKDAGGRRGAGTPPCTPALCSPSARHPGTARRSSRTEVQRAGDSSWGSTPGSSRRSRRGSARTPGSPACRRPLDGPQARRGLRSAARRGQGDVLPT